MPDNDISGNSPVLSTLTFVPEINFWACNILKNSPVDQTFSKLPVQIKESLWRTDGTFLDLLFNYTYSSGPVSTHYRIALFEKINDTTLMNRVRIYYNRVKIWAPDTSIFADSFDSTASYPFGESPVVLPDVDLSLTSPPSNTIFDLNVDSAKNIFRITFGERDMINLLLDFKEGMTIDLSIIDFDNLPSPLSKSIYTYLAIETSQDLSFFNPQSTFTTSSSRLVDFLYEKWVTDHYFRHTKFQPVTPSEITTFLTANGTSNKFTLTQQNIDDKNVSFPLDKIPLSGETIFVVHDAHEQILNKDYEYIFDSPDSTTTISVINWGNLELEQEVEVGDDLYVLWGHKETL